MAYIASVDRRRGGRCMSWTEDTPQSMTTKFARIRDLGSIVAALLAALIGGSVLAAPDDAFLAKNLPSYASVDDQSLDTPNRLTSYLSLGGRLESDYRFERNLDLDSGRRDTESILEPKVALAISYHPDRNFRSFVQLELSRDYALEQRQQQERSPKLELTHAFMRFEHWRNSGISLQLGRQRFRDSREWLFDEELDGVSGFYQHSRFAFELSATREEILDKDLLEHEQHGRINNYMVYGAYALDATQQLAAYVLARDDRSARRESPRLFGLRASGKPVERFEYWLELAYARGRDGSSNIRGFGFDVGMTYEIVAPFRPSFTLGYASGSGDADPNDGVDRNFRQSGLQGNEASFNGVTRFRYYGELFDPELSNLKIFTAGIGAYVASKTSLDLVYHHYTQHRASKSIRDSALNIDPSGRSKRLGTELDLIVGYRGIPNLRLEFMLGYFMPGSAFLSASHGTFARGEIRYDF